MRCFMCKGKVESGTAVFIGLDGDTVCSPGCQETWERQMAAINRMTDVQFEGWMGI